MSSAGVLAVVLLVGWNHVTGSGGFVSSGGNTAYVIGGEEQQRQVARVLGNFSDAGFRLPSVVLVTYRDLYWCPGQVQGQAHPFRLGGRIDVCLASDHSVAHELAHLYLYRTTTYEERSEFVDRRRLETWNSRGHEWSDRGTEHAANLVTWWTVDRLKHQYVYWKTRAESADQDLADLAWLLSLVDPADFNGDGIDQLQDPDAALLRAAGPVPRSMPPVLLRRAIDDDALGSSG